MGKIPTIAIIAIVVVLTIGISVAAFYFLIKPKQEELAGLKEKLAAEQAVVAQESTARAELAAVNAAWLKAQQELAALRERKSIPISMYMPLLAMTSMWYELREDLPNVVTNYLTSQGVTIQSGASMPAPQLAPPTVPSSGFLQVPEGQSLTLAVTGTLANIAKVYSNLAQMPRIATIGALNLTGTGERLTATFPMTLYIIVEGAEAASPPPAAAADAAGGPGGPGGPPADAGGGEEGGGKGEGNKGGEEEGGGAKSKGDDGGGGGEE
jgi:Tfp pilus assembly protein PilO